MSQNEDIIKETVVGTPLHDEHQHDQVPDSSQNDEENITYNAHMTQHKDIATEVERVMPLKDELQHHVMSNDFESDEGTLTYNTCMTQHIASKTKESAPMQDDLQNDNIFDVFRKIEEIGSILNKEDLIENLVLALTNINSSLHEQSHILVNMKYEKSSINFGTVSEMPEGISTPFRISKTDREMKEIEARFMEEIEDVRKNTLENLIKYEDVFKKCRLVVNDTFYEEAAKEITGNEATGSEISPASKIDFKKLLSSYNEVLGTSADEFDYFVNSIKRDLNDDFDGTIDFLISAFEKGCKSFCAVRSFFYVMKGIDEDTLSS